MGTGRARWQEEKEECWVKRNWKPIDEGPGKKSKAVGLLKKANFKTKKRLFETLKDSLYFSCSESGGLGFVVDWRLDFYLFRIKMYQKIQVMYSREVFAVLYNGF